MRISREDLNGFMENWDDQTKQLLLERMEQHFRRDTLEHFSGDEAVVLGAMLARMIPQTGDEPIDLVGFLDGALGKPLGRGERQEGLPPEEVLFHRGLAGVQETAQAMFGSPFPQLRVDQQDAVLRALQDGSATGKTWQSLPASQFFITVLTKALTGYCAHPIAWMRMGFPGPSYPEGYVWIGKPEIRARRRHFPGWKTL